MWRWNVWIVRICIGNVFYTVTIGVQKTGNWQIRIMVIGVNISCKSVTVCIRCVFCDILKHAEDNAEYIRAGSEK